MKPSSLSSDKLQTSKKEERSINLSRLAPFLLCSLGVTTIISFFIVFSPNPFKFTPRHGLDQRVLSNSKQSQKDDMNCDLFDGRWIPDLNGPIYTNSSCKTIPDSKNCFKNGRKDKDFLNWRWKPNDCELRRFNPKTFLSIFRGKKMAFIGDSVARNHMESLLCLLSQEEIAVHIYKDEEDRFRTWYFPHHDFTLMILWSKFLVTSKERKINGSASGIFDLHMDKVDTKWAKKLTGVDYAIISDAHWFFRKSYLYKDGNLIGCLLCNEQNVTDLGLGFAVRMAFRTGLNFINKCKECMGSVTLLRTFSPAHFENGGWNSGGSCNRTSPLGPEGKDLAAFDWELRTIQVEEIERARKEGEWRGKKFVAMDVTRAMLMRPDGHPGSHWGNKWMKGYNDCVHWCLPGPIDAWNDFLMATLRRFIS